MSRKAITQTPNNPSMDVEHRDVGGKNDGDDVNMVESPIGKAYRTTRLIEILADPNLGRDPYMLDISTLAGKRAARYSEIKMLTHQGVDANARDRQGVAAFLVLTQLWVHAMANKDVKSAQSSLEIITYLLDHGADLNARDLAGRTILMLAIGAGSQGMTELKDMDDNLVKLVVEKGARLDPILPHDSSWPTTPLITAVTNRKFNVLELLLSKKVNVNAQINGTTALLTAVSNGTELFPKRISNFVGALLEHGADVKADEKRILASAISHCPESVERFLSECYGDPQPGFSFGEDVESEEVVESSDEVQLNNSHPPSPSTRLSRAPEAITEIMRRSYSALMDKRAGTMAMLKSFGGSTSLGEELRPRVEALCHNCLRFEIDAVYRKWFPHSINSKSIKQSILKGCPLCQLIKDCLPESFGKVELYYYSALSESDTISQNYYERIIVRCQVPNNSIYGELRLATLDEEVTSALARAAKFHDRDTSSEAIYQLVTHWMAICHSQHAGICKSSQDEPPPLPSRVIDVGLPTGSGDPRLFISEGHRAHYVTLSYCWGTSLNLRTELGTLESFQKSIPFQKIPKTIQDAVKVTKKLGIRYLWVDTLCILQDSTEDWLREAKNIASVYRNSMLTIAAADAVDSDGGLFRPRKRLRTQPVRFAPRISPFRETSPDKTTFAFGDRQESNDAFRCQSQLDRRGWVLQEQLLSPRTLNYSSQEVYWECSCLLASESYPAGIPKDHDRNFERRYFMELKMKISATQAPSNRARVHMLWQHLIELYSQRQLSFETDKLVALAGAANQVSKVLDDTFLAGMWVKWLWRDLLWWTESKPVASRSTKFKAPSWSWASINGPISYKFPQGSSYMRYYPCIQVLGYGQSVHPVSNKISGFITIRGVIVPAILLKNEDYELTKLGTVRRTTPILRPLWASSNTNTSHVFWKGDTSETIDEPIQCLIVASSHQYVMCLGLLPTGRKQGEYRRIGLAFWQPSFTALPDEVELQESTIV
ncbi:heterokaryon incompatibility protein-domain-containing protein [Tricladium varicosporioides]|nr:heterokaryon incompatibility protein-domain-containing protein [Hymenoscyphus varicosporioides]